LCASPASFDEPLSNLDPKLREALRAELRPQDQSRRYLPVRHHDQIEAVGKRGARINDP
jgi:ABC-type sugar transport system ATPase subunit